MRLILPILIIIPVLFNSCISEKKRAEICASCKGKDSTVFLWHDSIVYKDTTLYVKQAGDTISIPVPCPDIKPFEKKKNKGGLITTLKSDGKTITADCAADSLQVEIERIRADHYSFVSKYKRELIEALCKREHRTRFDGLTYWWFWITAPALALFLGVKYLRRKSRF